ncbi:DnaA regulatory inactivator Hda [Geomonas silvestris]|uniref:DnaA regulatory inactivator Hda n=1 Tax=Geomonas silvestris TaxID=2740184 RepID=A0A6V8MJZ4_9BACT|nr:DnaA/Hda family protein [Geomonas silvestris]GFO60308.1 DnaA regulatory inactivator Hda [Geomonas silvestris]
MQLIFDFPVTPRFSFDNFVMCGGNKTAYQFARKLASEDGTENLLYVYGPEGSGKTHLLTALANEVGGKYLSLRDAQSLKLGRLDPETPRRLTDFFADAPALVLDDLHLLPNDQDLRVELWELFNAFYTSGKKIAMSGLVAPKELPHLDGHLTSRLLWGLVARMDVSDDDSRRMILKKLAGDRQMALPDEVIDQILLRVRRDIPSLVYALETINRHSISTKRKVGVKLAKESIDSLEG